MTEEQLETGKHWYTDTEFPEKKVRMDGIREYIIDANLNISAEHIDVLLNGIGYWFLKNTFKIPNQAYNQAIDHVLELIKVRAVISPDDKAFYKKFNTYRYPYGAMISEFEALKKPS